MIGINHHADTCAELRSPVRTSPAKTAAATVQSSPMMKWYQKRRNATGHVTIRFTLGRRSEPEHAAALESDVGRAGQNVQGE
jgi:hypothetical protein